MSPASSGVLSDKQDLLQALSYALDFFDLWLKEGRLTPEQHQVLTQYYQENRQRVETGGPTTEEMELRKRDGCWSCRAAVDPRAEFCTDCGVPLQSGEVQRLRYLIFLCHEIKKHETAGRINLATAHDLLAEGNSRIAALRRRLEKERVPLAQVVAAPAAPTAPVAETAPRKRKAPELAKPAEVVGSRRSVIEILLDPRTIQWLLASGGALLVLGLVIWLAAEGLFENKLFVAILLGAGNAALLAAGWALIYGTRYQTAGRAVTLLACLLMPLNLWFYDAQGLIPLQAGGHLWIPALVICVLYAASARLLKDAVFVPVFVGGVTLTGLLLLADRLLERFWEITGPATLLVVLGLAFIHAERLFSVNDGPFSRRKFGLAFFWSGHAVLACGLGVLLIAQLLGGWLFPLVKPIYDQFGFTQPEVVTTAFGKWWAIALVLAGTYAYTYSDLVVRRIGVYLPLAVFTLLWAEVLLITIFAEFLGIPAIEIVIVALALTGLLSNLVIVSMMKQQPTLLRVGAPLALFLCGLPVLLGVVLQIQGTIKIPELHYALDSAYVVAMLITAVSCRIGAYLYRHERRAISWLYFFGTGAATLAGAAGLLVVASDGKMAWHDQAPLLMLIPILYLIASRLYRGHTAEQPLGWVAHAATAIMLFVSVCVASVELLQTEQRKHLYLMLSLFFAEATFFYGLAAVTREKAANVYFGSAAAFAAVWQLFNYLDLPNEWYALAFAIVGLGLLILYRFAVLEQLRGGLAEAAFQCANALLLLAFTAAFLITGSELMLHFDPTIPTIWDAVAARQLLVSMLLTMTAASLLAVVLVKHQVWRRLYLGTSAINIALVVLVLAMLGTLTLPQKMEIAALVVGVLLLGVGYFGWYREQDKQNDLTSMALVFGCLLVAIPFTVEVIAGRWNKTFGNFHTFNEIGMLACGLLLLATGYACQLKVPTLTGAFMLVAWLLALALFLRLPEKLQTTAVYLMIGGGAFFLTGLFLSISRDRLLTLPERIKRHEGVFRVLGWR